jgi:hypothetical protein
MVLATLTGGPLAVLTELVSNFAGMMAAVTGMVAGSARALAVLQKLPPERIESTTAIGFVFGATATIAIVCIDLI